jgi:tRNA-specific 2-thiouridylase
MSDSPRTIVALSGGVDSAVAAWLLQQGGRSVECLHMSNWQDDDGYCDAATDLADARRVCDRLGVPLHRVNFAREYRDTVFADFLSESRAGRTPNPDVLCNREIKFGLLRKYARRLGATRLATGHYARLRQSDGVSMLLRGVDGQKDQSYFLHAVDTTDLADVVFPLGDRNKTEIRELARRAGLGVADKRDSTGICFIGERPFSEFLSGFIPPKPGPIVTLDGDVVGEHRGLHLYTLGQRKGLGVGGVESAGEDPWYVAAKRGDSNELLVVQGRGHPALFSAWLTTGVVHFIGPEPERWQSDGRLECQVKTRYRQPDQSCSLIRTDDGGAEVAFAKAQRAVTPGQYAVFYLGDRCLGGGRIERSGARGDVRRWSADVRAGRSTDGRISTGHDGPRRG